MTAFIQNPDFRLDRHEGLRRWEAMRRSPVPLARPVIVLNGYHAPRFTVRGLATRMASVTSGQEADFLAVAYTTARSIEAAAASAMRQILRRYPAVGDLTVPFDVIGVSMGGLVARLLASVGAPGNVRLNISRLFTLATPHRGAILARWFRLDEAAAQMLPGSGFLRRLDTLDRPHELVCYAQLGDWWVGATNAAPPDMHPIWTDADSLFGKVHSHVEITHNRKVLCDIARRLRGEPPLARFGGPPPRD